MYSRFKRSKKIKLLFFISLLVFIPLTVFSFFIKSKISNSSQEYIYYDIESVPSAETVLILGSKVYSDGRLSPILEDRVITALELYNSGKVKKFLVSGDHGKKNYDEVNTIRKYLLNKGVKAEDIFLDHAGFDTYDSFYRARDIFKVSSVIAVTQEFHLPRAVYIGRSLGLNVYGLDSDRRGYGRNLYNGVRELFSGTKAYLELAFGIKPKFLGNAIPITGDYRESWDQF